MYIPGTETDHKGQEVEKCWQTSMGNNTQSNLTKSWLCKESGERKMRIELGNRGTQCGAVEFGSRP